MICMFWQHVSSIFILLILNEIICPTFNKSTWYICIINQLFMNVQILLYIGALCGRMLLKWGGHMCQLPCLWKKYWNIDAHKFHQLKRILLIKSQEVSFVFLNELYFSFFTDNYFAIHWSLLYIWVLSRCCSKYF